MKESTLIEKDEEFTSLSKQEQVNEVIKKKNQDYEDNLKKSHKETIKDYFKQIDVKNTGYITREDMTKALNIIQKDINVE
jgi:Ca2+-binding EF-hand superfamily protein